jgi:TPR repeat protein
MNKKRIINISYALIFLVCIYLLFRLFFFITAFIEGPPVNGDFTTNMIFPLEVRSSISFIQGVVFIMCLLVFLVWVYTINKYLHQYEKMIFSPNWSVLWFIIPIAFFYKPYYVIEEIWYKSTNNYVTFVKWWWWSVLSSTFLGRFIINITLRFSNVEIYTATYTSYIITDGIGVIMSILTLKLITQVVRGCIKRNNTSFQGTEKSEIDAKSTYQDVPKVTSLSDELDFMDVESIYNLGVAYASGIGVERNDKKAVEAWAQAEKMNFPMASFNLGNWYFHGREVEQDYKKAVECYKKAADKGLLESINNLANCYYQGLGVPVNNAEAARLYLKAAEKGFAESQYRLGNCYYSGDGVEKNLKEMYKWHKKAAEQSHAEAQCNLGIYYADGIVVEKDPNEAYKWFKKAADQGEERAIQGLKMIKFELEIE